MSTNERDHERYIEECRDDAQREEEMSTNEPPRIVYLLLDSEGAPIYDGASEQPFCAEHPKRLLERCSVNPEAVTAFVSESALRSVIATCHRDLMMIAMTDDNARLKTAGATMVMDRIEALLAETEKEEPDGTS